MKPFPRESIPAALELAVKQYQYLFDCKFHGTETQFKALLELGVWKVLDEAHRARVREELEAFRDRILKEKKLISCDVAVYAPDIQSIDIDAFMDREVGK